MNGLDLLEAMLNEAKLHFHLYKKDRDQFELGIVQGLTIAQSIICNTEGNYSDFATKEQLENNSKGSVVL